MKKYIKILSIILITLALKSGYSQTTLYTQNFGTSGTTLPTGWRASVGTGTTVWYINSTTASSTYTGASGGNNVRAGSTVDTLYFSSVSTVGYTSITVIWGERRSSSTAPSPAFQWSSDSITWNTVTFTDVSTTAVWALVNAGTRISLPAGAAGVSKLRFRWIAAAAPTSGSLRIDDFNVQGTAPSLPPSKISIVSVNAGLSPDSCSTFDVIVETLDINGLSTNVTSATTVTLTKLTGTGTGVLSGGSGTIAAGGNTTTITVTYSRTGTGVSLKATAGTLTADTSLVFNVLLCTACSGTITYGGQVYNKILMGTQCWLKENLNIGTQIVTQTAQANNSTIEKYCYSNNATNCTNYGGLYQWAEMVQYYHGATNSTTFSPALTGDLQGICPTGWHIPTTAEWTTLQTYVGGATTGGGVIKQKGTTYWTTPNTGATTSNGFNARGGGSCNSTSSYSLKSQANFWSLTDFTNQPYYADYILLTNNAATMSVFSTTNGTSKDYGMSVRCLAGSGGSVSIKSNNANLEKFVEIYPNPTTNVINLKFTEVMVDDIEIMIFDVLGKLVYSELYNKMYFEKNKSIDISGLKQGNYIIKINSGKNSVNKKLIITN